VRYEGIIYDENTMKYRADKSLKQSNEATPLNRERIFSRSQLKRSQSAPRTQNDTENIENEHPQPSFAPRYPRNQQIQSKQKQNPRSKSEHRLTRPSLQSPVQFLNCTLIGDDFLLGFAMFTLKEPTFRFKNILQTGFCISGLTIFAATEKLRALKNPKFKKAIVYLGSFDVINGKELIELMNSFDEFVAVCKKRRIQIVACTLAPLPFHEIGNRFEVLQGFNKYLRKKSRVSVIDVNNYFLGPNDEFNELCYNEDSSEVSGSDHMVRLWNDFGREQFHKIILRELGQALLDDKPTVHGTL
jgi:hypothetical protein